MGVFILVPWREMLTPPGTQYGPTHGKAGKVVGAVVCQRRRGLTAVLEMIDPATPRQTPQHPARRLRPLSQELRGLTNASVVAAKVAAS